MRYFWIVLGLAGFTLSACDVAIGPSQGAPGVQKEYFVLGGSSMGFETCRANGGLIIHDQGSNMWACDPRVKVKAPPPEDEFDHPAQPTQ